MGKYQADFSLISISYSMGRLSRIGIISTGESSRLHWVIARPKPRFDNANNILTVFSLRIWVCLVATVVLMNGVFICLDYRESGEINWYKSATMSIIGFINEPMQASWLRLTTKSKIFLFFFWLPLAYCLCLSYKANLLVNLLAVTYDNNIDTTADVLKAELPVWLGDSGHYYDMFNKEPVSPALAAVRDLNVAKGGYFEAVARKVPEDVQRLRDEGKSIWLSFHVSVKKTLDVYRPSEEIVSRGVRGLPIGRNNPLNERLTLILMRYKEADLNNLPEGKEDNWPELRIKQQSKIVDGRKPIQLAQILSTSLILVGGLASAMLAFLLELALGFIRYIYCKR